MLHFAPKKQYERDVQRVLAYQSCHFVSLRKEEMPHPLEISARLCQEGKVFSISLLIHKKMNLSEAFFWNHYTNFRCPEEAAVWFFARYDDVPLVWYTDPATIPV